MKQMHHPNNHSVDLNQHRHQDSATSFVVPLVNTQELLVKRQKRNMTTIQKLRALHCKGDCRSRAKATGKNDQDQTAMKNKIKTTAEDEKKPVEHSRRTT